MGNSVLKKRKDAILETFGVTATEVPERIYSISKLNGSYLVEIKCRKDGCNLPISTIINGNSGLVRCICGEVYHITIQNPHLVKIKRATKLLRKNQEKKV